MKVNPVKFLLKKKVERKKLELQEKEIELKKLTPKLRRTGMANTFHQRATYLMFEIVQLNTYIKKWEL